MFKKELGVIKTKRPLGLRLYNRIMRKYNSHDLNYELQLIARHESAAYVKEHMSSAIMYEDRWALLDAALTDAKQEGSILECGVEKGDSTNFIARRLSLSGSNREIHAFDSFEGLPGEWSGTFERAGKFNLKGKIPQFLSNVVVHKGWFAETIGEFSKKNQENIAFIHIDCDIYSSTQDILSAIGSRIVPGTIVAFDEYFNYHNWQRHEYRAWQEFVESHNIKYSYRGFCARGGQVYVKIIERHPA